MSHRDQRAQLANDVARCEPSKPCHEKTKCARYMAPIPTHGASIADFSLSKSQAWLCLAFVPLRPTAKREPPPRPVKPWPSE
jgi:hypothetical protein